MSEKSVFEVFKKFISTASCPEDCIHDLHWYAKYEKCFKEKYEIILLDEQGGEDKGSYASGTYHIYDKETGDYTFIEVYGSYYSYDGYHFEGVREVTPKIDCAPRLAFAVNT